MAVIRSFRDLDVYKLSLEEAKKVFLLTKSFSAEERYSLTDQIRRSSRAVNAMVAEGCARMLNRMIEKQADFCRSAGKLR